MQFWVANTDSAWFRSLSARAPLDEVNFWSPSTTPAKLLPPGGLWLFKLRMHEGGWIVGGGSYRTFSKITARFAWDAFGADNGAATYDDFLRAVSRYTTRVIDGDRTEIGSSVLLQPFFLPPDQWIAPPRDWSPNLTRGKTYDSTDGAEGTRVWAALQTARVAAHPTASAELPAGYGSPVLVAPRLGQGSFRLLVTELYDRRCAVTNERTLPVLEAAHIKPYSLAQTHELSNGLLLRSDLHTLFDLGYVTVTPDLRFLVSRRIHEEFENGREYYALDNRPLRLPNDLTAAPSSDMLAWHNDVVYKD